MFEERSRLHEATSLVLDTICFSLAVPAALLLRVLHESIPFLQQRFPAIPWSAEAVVRSDYAILLVGHLIAWLAFMKHTGVYRFGRTPTLGRVLAVYAKGMLLGMLTTGGLVFALKMSISRLFFGYFFAAAIALVLAKQLVVVQVARWARRRQGSRRLALVVGPIRPAGWLARVIGSAADRGYELVGIVSSDGSTATVVDGVSVLGGLDTLDETLDTSSVEEVFLVGSAAEIATLAPVAQRLIERGRLVNLVTPMVSGPDGVAGRVTHFGDVPMLSYGPMPRDEMRHGIKRTADVVLSTIALLALTPVCVLVAAAIKLFDPGPILFRQQRLGHRGKVFWLYKFRSMRVDAEEYLRSNSELYRRYVTNDFKLPESEDPRVTWLGRLLRKTSLDELPQFWNVLRGDMTLVGPRPIVPSEIDAYEPYSDLLLSVKPGVTGRWQVSGRSDVVYPERAFLDLDYVGRQSVAEDFQILARTVPAVVLRRGAH